MGCFVWVVLFPLLLIWLLFKILFNRWFFALATAWVVAYFPYALWPPLGVAVYVVAAVVFLWVAVKSLPKDCCKED